MFVAPRAGRTCVLFVACVRAPLIPAPAMQHSVKLNAPLCDVRYNPTERVTARGGRTCVWFVARVRALLRGRPASGLIDSGWFSSTDLSSIKSIGAPRAQKMLKDHLSRFMYRQVHYSIRRLCPFFVACVRALLRGRPAPMAVDEDDEVSLSLSLCQTQKKNFTHTHGRAFSCSWRVCARS